MRILEYFSAFQERMFLLGLQGRNSRRPVSARPMPMARTPASIPISASRAFEDRPEFVMQSFESVAKPHTQHQRSVATVLWRAWARFSHVQARQ
jgi:hypothetical protein